MAGVLGLALGSFANVVIYRVPLGVSVVRPRSACPHCGEPVAPYDNVPLVSWIVLKGRCRRCGAPIRVRYPLIESLVAALFFGVTMWQGLSAELLILLPSIWFGVVLSAIDFDVRRLPRALTWPWLGTASAAVIGVAMVTANPWMIVRAAIASLAFWLFYLVVFLVAPRGLGGGDVALAPILGVVAGSFGWEQAFVGFFAAPLWGMVIAIVPMIKARALRGIKVPYGPAMIVGCATGVLWGESIVSWYLDVLVGI